MAHLRRLFEPRREVAMVMVSIPMWVLIPVLLLVLVGVVMLAKMLFIR